jgi:hypothetical protein
VGWKVHVTSGSTDTDNDFGNFRQGTKSGVKFDDTNVNHVKDSGEPGLNGWTINAYADNNPKNGTLDAAEFSAGAVATDTTKNVGGVDGVYSFSLNPGDYIVCEVISSQPGFSQTAPLNTVCSAGGPTLAAGGWAVTLTSGLVDANNDFGNHKPGQGCTPGFWQGGLGVTLWNQTNDPDWAAHGGVGTNPFTTSTLFDSFFTPYSGVQGSTAGKTMLDFVGTGGGSKPAEKAARAVVAAYLNASFGLDYPFTTTQISTMWTNAVTTNTRDAFLSVFNTLGTANMIGCPIH